MQTSLVGYAALSVSGILLAAYGIRSLGDTARITNPDERQRKRGAVMRAVAVLVIGIWLAAAPLLILILRQGGTIFALPSEGSRSPVIFVLSIIFGVLFAAAGSKGASLAVRVTMIVLGTVAFFCGFEANALRGVPAQSGAWLQLSILAIVAFFGVAWIVDRIERLINAKP